jgi:hypothetical protein
MKGGKWWVDHEASRIGCFFEANIIRKGFKLRKRSKKAIFMRLIIWQMIFFHEIRYLDLLLTHRNLKLQIWVSSLRQIRAKQKVG